MASRGRTVRIQPAKLWKPWLTAVAALLVLTGTAIAASEREGTALPITPAESSALEAMRRANDLIQHQTIDSAEQQRYEQRIASATDGQAEQILDSNFPAVSAAPPAPPKIADTAQPNVARLEGPGKHALISTHPVEAIDADGKKGPVDFKLDAQDGGPVEPANAPFELKISPTREGEFVLGPTPSDTITVTPLAARDSDAQVSDAGVLAPNTHVDTDTYVTPEVDGVETYEQLRSSAAPEAYRYELGLKPGQHPVLTNAGLQIIDGTQTIVHALPPMALDRAGVNVPTHYELNGNILSVVVEHRSKNYAYPVLLDPAWVSTYNWKGGGSGVEGWTYSQSPNGAYHQFANISNPGSGGLWLMPVGNSIYLPDWNAKMIYWAPGSTRIYAADWQHVSHLNDSDRQTMRLALYGAPQAQGYDHYATGTGFGDQRVVLNDPYQASTTAQMWLFTPACSAGESNCPRYIRPNPLTFANVGGADVYLTDNDYPTFTVTGLEPRSNGWIKAETRHVSFTARDGGSGIKTAKLSAGRSRLIDLAPPCDGGHNTPGQGAQICPFQVGQNFDFDTSQLPYGQVSFNANGTDFVGNQSFDGGTSLNWSANVDPIRPAAEVTGDLDPYEGVWSNPQGDKTIRASVRDNESGVATNLLFVIGPSGRDQYRRGGQVNTCPDPRAGLAPCPSLYSSPLTVNASDFPEGPIHVIDWAWDYAGNGDVAAEHKLWIDRTKPTATASGPLVDHANDWLAGDGTMDATVTAEDTLSGVAKVELVVTNEEGSKVLSSRDVCDGAQPTGGEHCPEKAAEDFSVDMADLPDGIATFEARAIDAAGNKNTEATWDNYVDSTDPPAPDDLETVKIDKKTTEISWDRVADTSPGSGVVDYEYQIFRSGQPIMDWQSVSVPLPTVPVGLPKGMTIKGLERRLEISKMPAGTKITTRVRAVDKAGNEGAYASTTGLYDKSEDCAGKSPCGTFSREDARDARAWASANAEHDGSGYLRVPNSDCVGFVSTALHTGPVYGFGMMREFKKGTNSWWVRKADNDYGVAWTESWGIVEDFAIHEINTKRMQHVGALSPSSFKLGDIVVFDWDNGDKPMDHVMMVTKEEGPALSAHSNERRDVSWPYLVNTVIPADSSIGRHWNYTVLRPKYKYANVF